MGKPSKANKPRRPSPPPLAHFANDSILPQPNTRLAIFGRSRVGKTTLLVNLIIRHYSKFCDSIIIMSPTYVNDPKWGLVDNLCKQEAKTLYAFLTFSLSTMHHVARILDSNNKQGLYTLFVIDDMTRAVREGGKAEKELDRIIANNRWLHCSMIESAQQVVHMPPEMRSNLDYAIVYNTGNQMEFSTLYSTLGIGSKEQFRKLLDYCCAKPYHFLYISRFGPITAFYHNTRRLDITLH